MLYLKAKMHQNSISDGSRDLKRPLNKGQGHFGTNRMNRFLTYDFL